jgi:hypothetical protein
VFGNDGIADVEAGRTERLNEFETSLPIRLDYEACLAYLLLPPAGGVLLLMFEQKSDYVRYVAFLLRKMLGVQSWEQRRAISREMNAD